MNRWSPIGGAVAVLLVVSVLLTVPGAALETTTAQPVSVSLAGPNTITAGNATAIRVRINTTHPVYGAEFTVQITPQQAQFTDLTKGSFLSQDSSSIVVVNEVSTYQVKYGETRVNSESGVTGVGTIATLTLTVPASTTAESVTLSFQDVLVANPQATALETTTSNLTIAIEGGQADQTTPTTTQQTTSGSDTAGTPQSNTGGDSTPVTTQTAVQTTVAVESAWQGKVDTTVMERFEAQDEVPVLIQVSANSSLQRLRERLASQGLSNVTVENSSRVITAFVSEGQVKTVAQLQSVTRIRYNPSTAQTNGTSTTTRARETTPETSKTTQTTTAQTETTRSTNTTVGSGPGFGISAVLVAIVLAVTRLARRRG